MSRIMNFFGAIGDGVIGFIFKIFFMMIILVAALAIPVVLIIYWPFTIALIIGLLCSERLYRYLNKRFTLRLPKYFYIGIEDFLATLHEGEQEIDATKEELELKKQKAQKQVMEMEDALRSIDEQLSQIKVKRGLKTLFRQEAEISPRTAKALEMELGKPRWTTFIDKASNGSNGTWDKLMA